MALLEAAAGAPVKRRGVDWHTAQRGPALRQPTGVQHWTLFQQTAASDVARTLWPKLRLGSATVRRRSSTTAGHEFLRDRVMPNSEKMRSRKPGSSSNPRWTKGAAAAGSPSRPYGATGALRPFVIAGRTLPVLSSRW